MNSDPDFYRWQGGVDQKLNALLSRINDVATSKEGTHSTMYARIEAVESRTDMLESKWDRLLGAAVGIGIGAGAVGGGVGALVTSLIG